MPLNRSGHTVSTSQHSIQFALRPVPTDEVKCAATPRLVSRHEPWSVSFSDLTLTDDAAKGDPHFLGPSTRTTPRRARSQMVPSGATTSGFGLQPNFTTTDGADGPNFLSAIAVGTRPIDARTIPTVRGAGKRFSWL